METIDRGLFLEGILKKGLQDDIPLPINCGQTISQPSIVAKMIEKLEINKNCKVLEVGTGSGYQTQYFQEVVKKSLFNRKARVFEKKS